MKNRCVGWLHGLIFGLKQVESFPQMSDYLESLQASIREATPFVKEHMETDIWKLQHILNRKGAWSGVLETLNKEDFYYVRSGQKFGFSEKMVNQLMTLSYKQGMIDGKTSSYNAGYDQK